MRVPEFTIANKFQSTIFSLLTLFTLFVATILYIVGFATEEWGVVKPVARDENWVDFYGLWKLCRQSVDDKTCNDYGKPNDYSNTLMAAQVISSFALVGAVLCLTVCIIYIFVPRCNKDKIMTIIVTSSCLFATIFGVLATALGVEGILQEFYRRYVDIYEVTYYLSYSFALVLTASVLFVLSTGMMFAEIMLVRNMIPV